MEHDMHMKAAMMGAADMKKRAGMGKGKKMGKGKAHSTFAQKVAAMKREHGYSDEKARKIAGGMVKKMER